MSVDAVWVPVLPSFKSFAKDFEKGTAGVGKSAGERIGKEMADGVERSKAAVEKASSIAVKAHDRVADATGKVRVAQLQLDKARESGTAVQQASAEERLAQAHRNEARETTNAARADKGLTDAKAKLSKAEDDAAKSAAEQARAIDMQTMSAEEAEKATARFADTNVALAATFAAGLAAAALAAKGLYDLGSQFDDMFDSIRIGTGASGAAFEGLQESALKVAQSVPAMDGGLSQIGSTMADLNTRLGASGPTLETLTSQFVQLQNMGVDADINDVTGALTQFNISADQAPAAMDDLFRISQATGRSVTEITSNLAKSGPALQEFGFGLTESAGLLGALDKAGLDSEKTLGSMTKALGTFAKEGKNPQQALWETISSIQELTSAGRGVEAIDLANSIFGAKGGVGFVAAVKSGKFEYDGFLNSIGASGDTILGVADETANFAEQWQLFKQMLAVELAPVAERVFGAVGDAMTWIRDNGIPAAAGFVNTLREWQTPLTIAATVVGALATGMYVYSAAQAVAAAGGFLAFLRNLTVVTKAQAAAQFLLNTAMWKSPITWVTAIIVGLVAGFIYLWRNSEGFRDFWIGLWESIKSVAAPVISWVKDAFTGLKDLIVGGDFTGALTRAFGIEEDSGFVDFILRARDAITDLWNLLSAGDFMGALTRAFGIKEDSPLISFLLDLRTTVVDTFSQLGDSIVQIWDSFSPVLGALKDAFASIWESVFELGKTVWDLIKTIWDPILKPALMVVGAILGGAIMLAIGAVIGAFKLLSVGLKVVGWVIGNVVAPVLSFLGDLLSGVIDVVTWLVDVFTIAFQAISAGVSWAWTNILKPVFDGLWTVIRVVAAVLMTVLVTPFLIAWNLLSAGVSLVWNSVLKPVFTGLGIVAQWVWTSVLSPVFGWIKTGFELLGQAFFWIWTNILKPVWDGIVATAQWVWTNVLSPIFDWIKAGFGLVGDAFSWIWNNVIKPAWDALGAGVRWVADNIVHPVFNGLKAGLDKVGEWFDKTVNFITGVWSKIKEATAAPVRFVIDTVYNKGIVAVWNKVAGWVGLDEIQPMDLAFASGTSSVLPGYSPGVDNLQFLSADGRVRLGLSGGEGIARPEVVKAMGPAAFDSLNAAAATGGVGAVRKQLGQGAGFASGGIISLGGFADGGTVADAAIKRVFDIMKREDDKPYQYGGTGNPSWDCSGLWSGIYQELTGGSMWGGRVFNTESDFTQFGFVPGANGRVTIGVERGGGGPNSHMAGTIDGINIESGGSNGVQFGPPAIGTADFPLQWTLAELGGQFIEGVRGAGGGSVIGSLVRRAFDEVLKPIIDSIPVGPGIYGGLGKGMGEKIADAVKTFILGKAPAGGGGSFTPGTGPVVDQVRSVFESFGWGSGVQWDAADWIISRESGWNPEAVNPSSGAFGLFQFLGGTKDTYLPDSNPNPGIQAQAGARYIKDRYGDPLAAKTFWEANNWYDQGGVLPPGVTAAVNASGKPEAILTNSQWRDVGELVKNLGVLTPEMQRWVDDGIDMLEQMANGFDKFAAATDQQGRLGTPEEWGAHFGGQFLNSTADGLLGLFGLDGIIGKDLKPWVADALGVPARLGAPDVLDGDGRVIGSKLQAPNVSTTDISAPVVEPAGVITAPESDLPGRGGDAPVVIDAKGGDWVSVDELAQVEDKLDGVIKIVNRKPPAAAVTRGGAQ